VAADWSVDCPSIAEGAAKVCGSFAGFDSSPGAEAEPHTSADTNAKDIALQDILRPPNGGFSVCNDATESMTPPGTQSNLVETRGDV